MIKWIDTQKELPPLGEVVLLWWSGGESLKPTLFSGTIIKTGDGNKPYWYAHRRHYSLDYAPYWAHINAPESEGKNE